MLDACCTTQVAAIEWAAQPRAVRSYSAPADSLLPREMLILPPIDWVEEAYRAKQRAVELYESLPPEAKALIDRAYEVYLKDKIEPVKQRVQSLLTLMNNTKEFLENLDATSFEQARARVGACVRA